MRDEYDFSKAVKNPYAKILKEQEARQQKQAEDEKNKDDKNKFAEK